MDPRWIEFIHEHDLPFDGAHVIAITDQDIDGVICVPDWDTALALANEKTRLILTTKPPAIDKIRIAVVGDWEEDIFLAEAFIDRDTSVP